MWTYYQARGKTKKCERKGTPTGSHSETRNFATCFFPTARCRWHVLEEHLKFLARQNGPSPRIIPKDSSI